MEESKIQEPRQEVNTGECAAFRSARAQLPAIIGKKSPLKPVINKVKLCHFRGIDNKKRAFATDHEKEHSCNRLSKSPDFDT